MERLIKRMRSSVEVRKLDVVKLLVLTSLEGNQLCPVRHSSSLRHVTNALKTFVHQTPFHFLACKKRIAQVCVRMPMKPLPYSYVAVAFANNF